VSGAHTKGPWSAKYYSAGGWRILNSDGNDINTEFRETFTEADARLIAAAPELLDALRSTHGALLDYVTAAGPADEADSKILEAARSAIAKADGCEVSDEARDPVAKAEAKDDLLIAELLDALRPFAERWEHYLAGTAEGRPAGADYKRAAAAIAKLERQ